MEALATDNFLREVMNAKIGSVHSQALGLDREINGLQEHVRRRLRS